MIDVEQNEKENGSINRHTNKGKTETTAECINKIWQTNE